MIHKHLFYKSFVHLSTSQATRDINICYRICVFYSNFFASNSLWPFVCSWIFCSHVYLFLFKTFYFPNFSLIISNILWILVDVVILVFIKVQALLSRKLNRSISLDNNPRRKSHLDGLTDKDGNNKELCGFRLLVFFISANI